METDGKSASKSLLPSALLFHVGGQPRAAQWLALRPVVMAPGPHSALSLPIDANKRETLRQRTAPCAYRLLQVANTMQPQSLRLLPTLDNTLIDMTDPFVSTRANGTYLLMLRESENGKCRALCINLSDEIMA